ncbi:phosphatidate phosphatase PAH1 SCDLUD_002688 [Saccharomycodes ludwigii]|uniref:phosphatidate phosphatase PAH1 n=1 Tax=Saccharomycodes ludwigii TaxID=36035 RepID=UPI001E83638E|nr:hypothetical protein SCDLUD_002688 [Saccharomycodes ludwigii]KAH3901202.1 hypothetical protein SCDLUD_002688 [Saccharomycodes ludwigii]
MQYVGRAIDSVSKTWSSINPATLSGAIDVIVVQHSNGDLSCSPFHVRFGKFQILKPSQKKVEVIINGNPTAIPMKLNDNGEAYFVFETESGIYIPDDLLASPVVSASSSPFTSPVVEAKSGQEHNLEGNTSEITGLNTPPKDALDNKATYSAGASSTPADKTTMDDIDSNKNKSNITKELEEPDFLDINETQDTYANGTPGGKNSDSDTTNLISPPSSPHIKLQEKLDKIKIPTKIDNNTGDLLLDIEGYKSNKNKIHDSDEIVKQILIGEFDEDTISRMIKEDENGNIRINNQIFNCESSHNSDVGNNSNNANVSASSPKNAYISGNTGTVNNNANTSTSDMESIGTVSSNESMSNFTPATPTSKPHTGMSSKTYIKSIRLTSDQLKCLHLKLGSNDLAFSIDKGRSVLNAKLFVWKWYTPIVISDIDGTITKSDALGHVMTMIGKDWTHPGVAALFNDIYRNGYNIMYLTARSAGQADSTRSYLRCVDQNGYKIPEGPVILSPDRTFTALKREVILKKPEVFKMACLNDIRKLYLKDLIFEGEEMDEYSGEGENKSDDIPTPFIAGFGNRITDAISYRSVGIPRSRIFTINPDGEVHMELLELAGYKSSYLHINELVDHFFPPVDTRDEEYDTHYIKSITSDNGTNLYNNDHGDETRDNNGKFIDGYSIFDHGVFNSSFDDDSNKTNGSNTNNRTHTSEYQGKRGTLNDEELSGFVNGNNNNNNNNNNNLSNPFNTGINSNYNSNNNNINISDLKRSRMSLFRNKEEKFTDVNFWRDPIFELDDLSDISDADTNSQKEHSKTQENMGTGKDDVIQINSSGSDSSSNRRNLLKHTSTSADNIINKDIITKNEVSLSSNNTFKINTESVGNSQLLNNNTCINNQKTGIITDNSKNIYDNDKNLITPHIKTRSLSSGSCNSDKKLGQQIYLDLGSPLSSPRPKTVDGTDINYDSILNLDDLNKTLVVHDKLPATPTPMKTITHKSKTDNTSGNRNPNDKSECVNTQDILVHPTPFKSTTLLQTPNISVNTVNNKRKDRYGKNEGLIDHVNNGCGENSYMEEALYSNNNNNKSDTEDDDEFDDDEFED